ncbi:MAG TPA: acyl-CoA dehydrogenase, partial [Micromonosporaceae bacterium]|nr:acyl-CoA dehydrogenase [Micromonosporaceae bacterium]
MSFVESEERQALRAAVAEVAGRYGAEYMSRKARSGGKTTELWEEFGKLGYLGVNVPEEYGGGGGGIGDLAAVMEELAATGCGLLLMVVSPAICATIIARFGTDDQKNHWLPRFADGSVRMAFAITEPDAGSNAHKLTTTGRRDGEEWVLNGRKVFISGVDEADAVLVVGRTEDARTGKLKPALWIVPTNTAGFEFTPIEMDIISPDKQFMLFLDDVRLPADALVGSEDAALLQLFAGLNPERIMAAAFAIGMGRYALDKAVAYANTRQVWKSPIGAHQAVQHPLAVAKIELELAKVMMQKAAWLYDSGQDLAAGESANMAKYAAAEACVKAVDAAVQTHGGNGMTAEYGLGALVASARANRIAPVSREMILNFVA